MSTTQTSTAVAVFVVMQLTVIVATTGSVTVPVQSPSELTELPTTGTGNVIPSTSIDGEVPSHEEIGDALEAIGADSPIFLPPVGYSRYDNTDPMENDTRRSVFEAVVRSPGTYLTRLAAETEIPLSTVRYHVRVLDDEHRLRTAKINGKRCIFPVGLIDDAVNAAVTDPVTRRVLDALKQAEPASVSGIASMLDRSPSTVSYHLSRLESSGLIARERDGAKVSVVLTPAAREQLATESAPG